MRQGQPDPNRTGVYFLLAQVGLEMVAPIVVGLLLDFQLGWLPWATIGGALLGLVGGVVHLVSLQSRRDDKPSPPGPRETP